MIPLHHDIIIGQRCDVCFCALSTVHLQYPNQNGNKILQWIYTLEQKLCTLFSQIDVEALTRLTPDKLIQQKLYVS